METSMGTTSVIPTRNAAHSASNGPNRAYIGARSINASSIPGNGERTNGIVRYVITRKQQCGGFG
jgi:hypothetical protein